MVIQSNFGGRVLALAATTVLTVVLVWSLGMQGVLTPASGREEEAARLHCQERLVHAAEAAYADGDADLAHWIESLPAYPIRPCHADDEPR